jgi:hypothetical protein
MVTRLTRIDNREFNVNGADAESFGMVLELAMLMQGISRVHSWGVIFVAMAETGLVSKPNPTLVLSALPYDERKSPDWMRPIMPGGVSSKTAVQMAGDWLKSEPAERMRGPAPDIDGDALPGWRVYVERWGRIGGTDVAVGIEPIWALCGK